MARPVQAHPERRRGAAEDACGLLRVEAVPGDQAQNLALALVKALEGAGERVAAVQRLDRLRGGCSRGDLGLESIAQLAPPPSCAPLIGDDSQGDSVEPRQGFFRDELAPPPGDREGFGRRVLGRRPVREAADREGENRRIVVAEAALETAIGVRQGSGLVAGGGHLCVDVPHHGGCYSGGSLGFLCDPASGMGPIFQRQPSRSAQARLPP